MAKKGFFNKLRSSVTTTTKDVAKRFKRKHKLTGKSLNVKQIFSKSAWQRGTMLIESSGYLLVLVVFLALMIALKEEPTKLYTVMGEMAYIGGAFMVLAMHFTAGLLVWAVVKAFGMLLGPVWEFLSDWAPLIWEGVKGLFT